MTRLFTSIICLLSLYGLQAEERPNILLIMADDLGIEGLGCYGGDSYPTPRLDQLAEEGMRFTHGYSQPLCTPTRVQIMTGKYNHRNWLYFGILDPSERTFGHLMSDAGYRTAIAGKWQLQSYDPPDFPGSEKRRGTGMKVNEAGFDEYQLFHSWHTEDKGSRYGHPSYDRNGEIHKDLVDQYGPDASVDFILDFYRRHQDEPSFVYYPMALPHWPVNPTPDSADWSDPKKRLAEDDKYFADMVTYMDKLVGRLVDGLQELGLREKTLVIFYSDNGTDKKVTSQFRGQPVKGGKNSVLQTGIRVPLIISQPGTVKPAVVSDLVDASDFLPTFAELAGIDIPSDWHCDGISFAPVLSGQKGTRDTAFFWYDPRPGWDKEQFRRHIFALDHNYKRFSDGRFFAIDGDGFKEQPLDSKSLTGEAEKAYQRLGKVIDTTMSTGPISAAAKMKVDAFGNIEK